MTASFLHYISLFLSVFFVTNKMRLPCSPVSKNSGKRNLGTLIAIGVNLKEWVPAIPNSECSQRYKRLDVFTGKGFAMKIAN
jgi:hypothetical protein